MDVGLPLISVIVPTYNRANTIERAVFSILNQTYIRIEVIIVDDGSTDNTSEILERINDPRIKVVKHEYNKGVTAAKNTGLRYIKGAWFTILDSDDEIVPEAIEMMINIPLFFDKNITAVTCNCFDTSKKDFSGIGLMKDQYLDIETIMTICKGEYWGLTKTSLLMDDYFNENLNGFESTLWFKIDDRANRYYIHKPLRIYYTEGVDRISNSKYDIKKEIRKYTNIINEVHYINKIRKFYPEYFINICLNGLIITRSNHNKEIAKQYYKYLSEINKRFIYKLILNYWLVANIAKNIKICKQHIKPYLKASLK